MPSSRWPAERAALLARPFAHRGLHGGGSPADLRVENSRAAFAAAIDAGCGIELDVRPAACGTPMVFHDADLARLTGAAGRLDAHDAAALGRVRLAGTDEGIPTLAEILALVGGRVPVLVELKTQRGRRAALCRAVEGVLADAPGPAAVMSFDPSVPWWFARHAPRRPRGLVAGRRHRGRVIAPLAVPLVRPHFVALDVRDLPSPLSRAMRARGVPVLSWTVRTHAERATAAAHADQIIFEGRP